MPSFTVAKISLAYMHNQILWQVASSVALDIAFVSIFNSIKAKQFLAAIYGGLTFNIIRL